MPVPRSTEVKGDGVGEPHPIMPDRVTAPALQDRQGGVCAEAGPEKQLLICCAGSTLPPPDTCRVPCPCLGSALQRGSRRVECPGKVGQARKNTRLTASQFLFIYLFFVFFSFFFF